MKDTQERDFDNAQDTEKIECENLQNVNEDEEAKKKEKNDKKMSIGNFFWTILKKCIGSVMRVCLKIVHVQWDEQQWDAFFQFVRFCIVGVTNTLVSYLVNVITLLCLSPYKLTYDYIIANVMAFILSVMWAYILSTHYVFDVSNRTKKEKFHTLVKTYASYAITGLILNNVLSACWIHIFYFSKYVAPLLNIIFCVPCNFFLNKKWAYKS